MPQHDGRVIICFSHLNWDRKLFQRPQQLMSRLERNFNILYISDPSFKSLVRKLFRRRQLDQYWENGENGDLTIYSPPGLPTFHMKFLPTIYLNKVVARYLINRKLKQLNPELRILWLYHPRYVDIIGRFGEQLIIYD